MGIWDTYWVEEVEFGAWVEDTCGDKNLSFVGIIVDECFLGQGNIGLEARYWSGEVLTVEVEESTTLVLILSCTAENTK